MQDHLPRAGRWTRLSLLLAALLYLAGVAVEPLVHPAESGFGSGAVAESGPGSSADEGTDGSEAPAPHNDLACVLCRVLSKVALPELGSLSVVELAQAAGVAVLLDRDNHFYRFFSYSPSQPRAPPLS